MLFGTDSIRLAKRIRNKQSSRRVCTFQNKRTSNQHYETHKITLLLKEETELHGMTASSIQKEGSSHQHIGLKFKEETTKCYIWSIISHGAETQTVRKVGQF